ncbi:MogA/MoaB family molybdenum cofactor biosynthesis protein [Dehalococcoidia bacterium]|nr:MogA/MoaB family molybdenum cofactor biosynthesis protein [Dehalococcoidia bacterium]
MLNVAILTISDAVSSGHRKDKSGDNIAELVGGLESRIVEHAVVPDERDQIAAKLRGWSDVDGVDLVLTTGGTGLAPRDVTPEATRDVIEREVPGIAESMRFESAKANSHAILSRGVVGSRGKTLIVNLPGSPKGVTEMLAVILPVLPHAVEILKGMQDDHTPPSPDSHSWPHDHHPTHF